MNRIGSLTLIIGVAVLIVVGLACGAGEKQDPANAGPASDAQQAQGQPGPSGSPGEDTSPVVTGGGTPRASLTYEGLAYYQDPLSTDEAANLNEDDLEFVGFTTESNLLAPGSGDKLDVYRLKNGEEGDIYTLEPGQSFQNEDGRTITIEPEWVRWFRELTEKQLRRGTFSSVEQLIQAIHDFLDASNLDPKPFMWTASVHSILEKVARCKPIYETLH